MLPSRNVVLSVFQAYRVVVLPVANTWMSWSLLNKMSVTPSWPMIALLGFVLLACIIMGLQVRRCADAVPSLCSCAAAAVSTRMSFACTAGQAGGCGRSEER